MSQVSNDPINDSQEVLIVFPCDYPVSVVSENDDTVETFVIDTIKEYCDDFDGTFQKKYSRNSKYVSIKVVIMAQSEEQLKKMHEALKSNTKIHVVL